MAFDQLPAELEQLLLDMEHVAKKLARVDTCSAASGNTNSRAKDLALALAAAASAVARDAALLAVSLEDASIGSNRLRHRGSGLSKRGAQSERLRAMNTNPIRLLDR